MVEHEHSEEELIDLGSIAEQTRGSEVNFADTNGGERLIPDI